EHRYCGRHMAVAQAQQAPRSAFCAKHSLGRRNVGSTTYPTDVSALILIDLLNDFLSPMGKAYSRLAAQVQKVNFIPNVTRLLAGARAAGLQIVYAPHGLNEHSFDGVKYIPTRMVPAMENHIFWEGEFGDEFFEPFRPGEGDIVASHHRSFDAFMGTDL